jgi:hypothetical protein
VLHLGVKGVDDDDELFSESSFCYYLCNFAYVSWQLRSFIGVKAKTIRVIDLDLTDIDSVAK